MKRSLGRDSDCMRESRNMILERRERESSRKREVKQGENIDRAEWGREKERRSQKEAKCNLVCKLEQLKRI